MTYQYERNCFDMLKRGCSKTVKREYENAIKVLLGRYNTTIHENRFVIEIMLWNWI